MIIEQPETPTLSDAGVAAFLEQHYGLSGRLKRLDSYMDLNFRVGSETDGFHIFKVANAAADSLHLDAENAVLTYLAKHASELPTPRLIPNCSGDDAPTLENQGKGHSARLLSWLEGTFLGDMETHPQALVRGLGRFFGKLDKALLGFKHAGTYTPLRWDLKMAASARPFLAFIKDHEQRSQATYCLDCFDREVAPNLVNLPMQVIHNDGNDFNILINPKTFEVAGLIDFGDMVYSARIAELAIVAAYLLMGKDDPLSIAADLVASYHAVNPLKPEELEVFLPMVLARLAMSVSFSSQAAAAQPDNAYLTISQQGAWSLMARLIGVDLAYASHRLRAACGMMSNDAPLSSETILQVRKDHLNPTLSLSYTDPLKMMRGFRQYLYEADGTAYLDCVNNVCHVGHSHPYVVAQMSRQMAALNTNTRYLHPNIVEYAQALLATLPDHLSVCTFVCSGTEANDLALRMARHYTGRHPVAVIEGAYHGNSTATIEISPYKYRSKGGKGKPEHISEVRMPDPFRGQHRGPDSGPAYARHLKNTFVEAEAMGKPFAAFIAESILGCGGQVVLPDGYLKACYDYAQKHGALTIADEVQVGFGRVGSHFWAFETQGVLPDIVTMGKPIGNGHPLAAVVTTREIADAFHNGMEFFNTFGGNPVSCAAGKAVLEVIEAEGLQDNALEVGTYLKAGLTRLMDDCPAIGEVRGLGLFLGIEFVTDRQSLQPDPDLARAAVEAMKARRILLSTDGPDHNVIKMKPPIVFTKANADHLISNLAEVLHSLVG